jgi:D-alanyl-D-alanine dipeptidase
MPKNENKAETTKTAKVRAVRTPRTKTAAELEAEQNLRDVKDVAKILPKVAAMSKYARAKLSEAIDILNTEPAITGTGDASQQ